MQAPDTPTAERVVTKCDTCGQEDDHPRHIMYGVVTFTDPITREEVTLDRSQSRHFDCCNCDHCTIILTDAGEKRGLDLVNHVVSMPDTLHSALTEAGYDLPEKVTNG